MGDANTVPALQGRSQCWGRPGGRERAAARALRRRKAETPDRNVPGRPRGLDSAGFMVRTIIWDWNGTLLDDVDSCVATLNELRERRGMEALSREQYRDRFGFPVRAFYESIGFDFTSEPFADLSRDFIAAYRRRASEMRVAPGAREAMRRLSERGVNHIVISAMEATLLGEMLAEHRLHQVVTGWFGTSDHTAGSKVELGAAAVRRAALLPESLVVVGDTLHDLELARAIGCRALLYGGGHMHRRRLADSGVPVIDDFAELDDHMQA
jgi:phosphoglycolate phosphatase